MKWIKSYPEMLSESRISDLPGMQKRLISLIRHDEISRARDLIDYGVEPNFTMRGLTPLDFAIMHASPEMVEMLIDHGAEINARNQYLGSPGKSGVPPIFTAAAEQRPEMVRLLVERGADLEMTMLTDQGKDSGETVLHRISYLNEFSDTETVKEIAKILIENGLSPNRENWRGFSPFHISMIDGNAELVQFFIDNGANVNQERMSKGNRSLLIELPINKGFIIGEEVDLDIVKVLILNGVDFMKKFTTFDKIKEFFKGDFSWYPGGEEAMERKYRSREIRRNLF